MDSSLRRRFLFALNELFTPSFTGYFGGIYVFLLQKLQPDLIVDAIDRHWSFDPFLNLVTFSHAGSIRNRAWLAPSRFFQRLNRIKNLLRKKLNRSRRGCGNLGKR
jgi:hypothetical protein